MLNRSAKAKAVHVGSLLVILSLFAGLGSFFAPLQKLEQWTLDFRYAHFNRYKKASSKVVVIDIDEQSLKLLSPYYGRWPWPRRLYKDLIAFLEVGEPKAILFDILFTEKNLHSNDDKLLAKASAEAGNVSHAVNLLEERAETGSGASPFPKIAEKKFVGIWENPNPGNALYRDFVVPGEDYLSQAIHLHIVTFPVDADGAFRRAPLLFNYEDKRYPSLALSGILFNYPNSKVSFSASRISIETADARKILLPLDKNGYLPLHFYSPDRDPESISFAAVLSSAIALQRGTISDPKELKVNPLEFKDKIVVVGSSAVGLSDLKQTPIHPAYPGVKLQTTAISNVLEQDFLRPISFGPQWLLTIGVVVFTLVGLFYFSQIRYRLTVPFMGISIYLGVCLYAFRYHSVGLEAATPFLLWLVVVMDGFAYIGISEGRERKKLESALSKYLAPSVMSQLISSGMDPRAEIGRQECLTILFADIRNFTQFTEKSSPEKVVTCLNAYLDRMTSIIFDHQGTVDKFIGDAIMAFWGAPLRDEKHAQRAVQCAFAMQEALASLKKEWHSKTGEVFEFSIGIGINTGRVIIGNIGGGKRLDYTIIGDAVNAASRIESLTKNYKTPILLGEETVRQLNGEFLVRSVDRIQIRGKSGYNELFEPLQKPFSKEDTCVKAA